MDLVLGHFAESRLAELPQDGLDLYEALLEENDQDICAWVTDRATPPEALAGLIAEIADDYRVRQRGGGG